jgi:hypothetical protein
METDLIAILIAVGIAALASPVTAQSASYPRNAHGSVARAMPCRSLKKANFAMTRRMLSFRGNLAEINRPLNK